MFKYWIYRFGQFCVTRLPLKLSYTAGMFLSDLQYYLSFRDRRTVKENLRVITGGAKQIEPLARDVFRNFGKYLVEFFRMAQDVNDEFIKARVALRNLNRIDEVLKRGKGALLLTAHIGNWELGGVILSRLGYSSLAIALPHKERPVNNLFNRQREQQGLQVVSIDLSIRRSLEALSQNQCVAVLADRNFSDSGEVINFLGRRVLLPKGPAIFSLRTGAAIIPIFLIREKGDRFTLMVEEPIYPPPARSVGGGHDGIVEIMNRYAAVIEDKVRQYPSQWLMFRKFWIE